jgi:hypothetical protein
MPFWGGAEELCLSIPSHSVADAPPSLALPGQRYRVVEVDLDWALVQREGDPPSSQVWIRLDERVQFSSPIPAEANAVPLNGDTGPR